MSYVIKEGQRTISMKVSYAAWWGVCWAHIFRSKGWAIIPNKHIACPACRKGKGQANNASSGLLVGSGEKPAKVTKSKKVMPAASR